jgi:hypothetical protein
MIVTITAILSSCGQRETVVCMHFLGYFVQGSRVQKLVPDEVKRLSFRGRRFFEAQYA